MEIVVIVGAFLIVLGVFALAVRADQRAAQARAAAPGRMLGAPRSDEGERAVLDSHILCYLNDMKPHTATSIWFAIHEGPLPDLGSGKPVVERMENLRDRGFVAEGWVRQRSGAFEFQYWRIPNDAAPVPTHSEAIAVPPPPPPPAVPPPDFRR